MSNVAKLFDDWAAKGRAEGMETGHMVTAGPAISAIQLTKDTNFLDLGCGNAWASMWAKEQGAHPIALDLSPAMVQRASNRGIHAARADMQNLPIPDNTIQTVWSMEAIYYAPNPQQVLQEIARVLAPGGSLHILIDFYGENEASHSWPTDVGVPMSLHTQEKWLDMMAQAGLQNGKATRLKADSSKDPWKATHGTLYLQANA